MLADETLLGLIDLTGEKGRAPQIGMNRLHEPAVRFPHFGFARAWAKAEDLMGLVVGQRSRARRAAAPRCRTRLRVLAPSGMPAVEMRFQK